VIVHQPGLELSRLTPGNVEELLFDDILWASRGPARSTTPSWGRCATRGLGSTYFGDLLAETLRIPEARVFVLDRVINDHTVGPTLVLPAREMAESIDADTLASYLVGGILKRDLDLPESHRASLLWQQFDAEDFVLTPLPNHLFQRDNSA
jgi:arginine deiminase